MAQSPLEHSVYHGTSISVPQVEARENTQKKRKRTSDGHGGTSVCSSETHSAQKVVATPVSMWPTTDGHTQWGHV